MKDYKKQADIVKFFVVGATLMDFVPVATLVNYGRPCASSDIIVSSKISLDYMVIFSKDYLEM